MKSSALLFTLVAVVLFGSALLQVYAVHLNRVTFIELQRAVMQRDEMNIEWSRLQIEQAAWSTHSRIEQVATQRLQMTLPDPSQVVVVRK